MMEIIIEESNRALAISIKDRPTSYLYLQRSVCRAVDDIFIYCVRTLIIN